MPTLSNASLFELGGNDAGIILDDFDVKAHAETLFWGAFLNNGQTCAALSDSTFPILSTMMCARRSPK